MADNGIENGNHDSKPITMNELVQYFASATFANHVAGAINPKLDKLVIQQNKNTRDIVSHAREMSDLKSVINTQDEKIKALEKKILTRERTDNLQILKITGLQNSEGEATQKLILLAKETLEVTLNKEDFTIRLVRPGNDRKPAIHKIALNNIWKRKQLYQARSKLKGTSIYISENLTKEQELTFYKCRVLRKSKVIKSTWTFENRIYIRTLDDKQHKVDSENDLKLLKLTGDTTPFTTPRTSPAPSEADEPGDALPSDTNLMTNKRATSSLQLFSESDISGTQGFEVRSETERGSDDSDDSTVTLNRGTEQILNKPLEEHRNNKKPPEQHRISKKLTKRTKKTPKNQQNDR